MYRRTGVHRRIGEPANRRTGETAYRRTGVSDSNVQHNRLVHRRIGVPAYQIPTFNTTDWYTGESAYRRIRFQRSTQQIGTPANRRTGEVTASNVSTEQIGVPANRRTPANRQTGEPAYRRIGVPANRRIRFQRSTQQIGTPANRRTGVSDSNVQYNRLVHRRIGVPAYQIPTPSVTGKMPQLGTTVDNTVCTFRSNSKTELTRAPISAGFYRKKVAGYRPAAHSARRFGPTRR